MTAPTRRGLLAGAAGLTVAPLAAGAAVAVRPHLDADLLVACAAFDTLERAHQDSYDGAAEEGPEWEAAEAERDRLIEAQKPWLEQIVTTQALTLEGMRAKAATIVLWDEFALDADPDSYTDDRIRSSLLRDLAGGAA